MRARSKRRRAGWRAASTHSKAPRQLPGATATAFCRQLSFAPFPVILSGVRHADKAKNLFSRPFWIPASAGMTALFLVGIL
ncbi:MAG TPA: hypothetical protein PK251_11130 [Candidatus Latescibacteria bacterium]|nr:hypothetical protein [Candidatus Latescibacterota bacterium]HOS65293.1 hypothetical protein [Candidatus Latescibacterota bacterium]HPK75083.1 hypothetical protein [Candidatus Latescibacterota bacterium]